MKIEQFEKILKENEIDYVFEKGVLIVNDGVDLRNNHLTSLPENIIFKGYIDLNNNNLTSLPDNIIFNSDVYLSCNNLTLLPDDIIFNSDVYLSYNNFNVPIAGKHNRQIIIFNGKYEAQIRLGCWQGNEIDTLKRIAKDYGENSDYYKIVKQEFDNFNNKGIL